jgi:hypothetical protein
MPGTIRTEFRHGGKSAVQGKADQDVGNEMVGKVLTLMGYV